MRRRLCCAARRDRRFRARHERLLMRFFDTAGAGLLFAAAAMSAPAFAQDDPITGGGGPISLSGEVAVDSDYRFRGLSLEDEEIAVPQTLPLSHKRGPYAGVWGTAKTEKPEEG